MSPLGSRLVYPNARSRSFGCVRVTSKRTRLKLSSASSSTPSAGSLPEFPNSGTGRDHYPSVSEKAKIIPDNSCSDPSCSSPVKNSS